MCICPCVYWLHQCQPTALSCLHRRHTVCLKSFYPGSTQASYKKALTHTNCCLIRLLCNISVFFCFSLWCNKGFQSQRGQHEDHKQQTSKQTNNWLNKRLFHTVQGHSQSHPPTSTPTHTFKAYVINFFPKSYFKYCLIFTHCSGSIFCTYFRKCVQIWLYLFKKTNKHSNMFIFIP